MHHLLLFSPFATLRVNVQRFLMLFARSLPQNWTWWGTANVVRAFFDFSQDPHVSYGFKEMYADAQASTGGVLHIARPASTAHHTP